MNINSSISFGIATNAIEKQEIYRLRAANYYDNQKYLLNFDMEHLGEDKFDSYSFLFYLKLNDTIVGTSRLTPISQIKGDLDGLIPGKFLDFNPEEYIYFNRVLIDSSVRNHQLHEIIFYNFSKWLLENTQYKNYFSFCRTSLTKLYTKYGITKANQEVFMLETRNNNEYNLIEGNILNTFNILNNKLNNNGNIRIESNKIFCS